MTIHHPTIKEYLTDQRAQRPDKVIITNGIYSIECVPRDLAPLIVAALQHTPQPSPQSDMVAVPREVVEKIASAMTIAKATIKIWHDMGLKKYDPVFEFYERNSPEMKTINEAITMLQPYTKGE